MLAMLIASNMLAKHANHASNMLAHANHAKIMLEHANHAKIMLATC